MFTHSRIRYEIEKYISRDYDLLSDFVLSESRDISLHLLALNKISHHKSFKSIYPTVGDFIEDIMKLNNPYKYAKTLYNLLISHGKNR